MSVRLMTPLILPDRVAPVMAEAEIAGATAPVPDKCVGAVELKAVGPVTICGSGVMGDGGTREAGVSAGVDGPDEDGEGLSTTHIRWERVATIFATVWASVLKGLTWKTGKESLPSFMPRSESMTEMKWMQEERRRGRDVDLVSNCVTVNSCRRQSKCEVLTRTSTCEMLPMTLFWASRTGSEDTPSLFMSSRAAARGLSPLFLGQHRMI
jgi:hypothetical protein